MTRRITRRAFTRDLATLVGSLGLVCLPVKVDAQQPAAPRRIGVLLVARSPESKEAHAFRQELLDAGYSEGRDVVIEWRSANGDYDRIPELAADLVQRKVDVIVVEATLATQAVKRATSTIPIVLAVVADPVGSGLVANLAHPGGNVTGLSLMVADLSAKRLQLLKEAIPQLTRVAVLWNPATPYHPKVVDELKAVAPSLAIELSFVGARTPEEFGPAFSAISRAHAQALYVLDDAQFVVHRRTLLKLASKARLPVIYSQRNFPDAGALMSYGPSIEDLFRRSAGYCHRLINTPRNCRLNFPQSSAQSCRLRGQRGWVVAWLMILRGATARRAGVIKLRELIVILDLHKEGLSVSAIAERTGLDRKTIRKYIARGVEPPQYGPRQPRPRLIASYEAYVRERLAAFPELSIPRLLREIRALGYTGGHTMLGDFVREVRPVVVPGFEVRFETEAGQQAQVDFAHFKVAFDHEPEQLRVVWLFSLVLGHSRYLWGRFCVHQDLQTLLRLHIEAFEHLGGVPREILYDRMKTAVLGEGEDEHIVYNRSLLALAGHYGFEPRACKPYRAKTKGKVERPYRYIRQDFFLGGRFADLEDLNAQLQRWLETVANARVHGTTDRVVGEHFAEERVSLLALPVGAFNATLKLERRISHEGMVSVGGNRYSVPDGTRSRTVEVHTLAQEIRIFEDGALIAVHPVLQGRRQCSVLPGHRKLVRGAAHRSRATNGPPLARAGEAVARRPLSFYDAVGKRLAGSGRRA